MPLMTSAPQSRSRLLERLLAFGALLRAMGVAVSPGQMLDLVAALDHVGLAHRDDLWATARCILVLRHEDLPLFDAAFALFWDAHANGGHDQGLLAGALPRLPAALRSLHLPAALATVEQAAPPEAVVTYSPGEALRHKDFGQFTWEEVQACKALLQRLEWRIAPRPTRRRRPARQGRRLDLRRTLRQNMRYGGEPLHLVRRAPRTRQRPLVAICDISGSMERYSRILLQFLHTVSHGLRNVETFVFGTRLTRITRQLRQRDIDSAIAAVARHVVDWSGGTRIGAAVKTFNFVWGRRVLGRGPVVLLISDGWDRGDPELLRREMDRLQRSCHRLIWLNPLLGNPDYRPLTQGMQAALPFIDDFLPVHNLASLEQLGERLATLAGARPARPQTGRRQP